MEPKSWCFRKPGVNALTTSYNEQIRPLLAAIDRLRQLQVIQEQEIKLRPIVFVGNLSFGKSSVIESLTGVRLPGGKGIRTRLPIIVRLQDDPSLHTPRLHLEYKGKRIESSETDITEAIEIAISEIAGPGKCISDTPITVVVRSNGLPDLTLVDLPGITFVPVHGQPENISEQVSGIIMKYIKPAESIILNVISAGVSFTICESIRLSKQVDRTGERTLAVITKVDKAPEGLLEKVTADDVNIGLGYVCVRNRIGSESFEEARASEAELFESHHLLSKIDKSIVGIPVLAQRLMKIQARSIAKCLPADIMKKINDMLNLHASELEGMPPNLVSIPDAMRALMQIISRVKESLKKLLITEEFEMQGTSSRLISEMLNTYANDMLAYVPSKGDGFLMEEIEILEEARVIGLSNFLPKTAFITLFQRKLKDVSTMPHDFVSKVWSYAEEVVLRVLGEATENYPNLQLCAQIMAQNLIDKTRKKSHEFVKEYIDLEKTTDYTCSPYYTNTWTELMHHQEEFMRALCNHSKPTKMTVGLVGEVEVSHLRGKYEVELTKQAFHLRILLISYWKCVVIRLVDVLALHVRYAVNNLVDGELESEIVKEVVQGYSGNLIEKMLDESSRMMIARKMEPMRKRIQLLEESKDVLGKTMNIIN